MSGGGGGGSSSSMRTAAAAGRCTRGADAAVGITTRSVAVRTTRRRGHRRRRRGEGCHQRSAAGRCSSRWEATLDWVRSAAVCYFSFYLCQARISEILLQRNPDKMAKIGISRPAWPESYPGESNPRWWRGGRGTTAGMSIIRRGGVAQRRPGSNRSRSGPSDTPSKEREQREREAREST